MNKFLDQAVVDDVMKYVLDVILQATQQKELDEIIDFIFEDVV